ncbi:hypothetical protein IAU60_004860 [Kwoniella sp. DSM 27419]
MEGQIDNANKYLNSKEGEQMKAQLFDGDENAAPSFDHQGNQGAPGQYGQEGQYGAVTGKGFGGGFAGNNQGQGQGEKDSPYAGMDYDDSTASGGYGRNPQGDSFSRQNQMGTDHENHANPGGTYQDDGDREGVKTGYSTPGYRKEGEDEDEQARRLCVYGQQADDRGAKGNDYNEAEN